MEFLICSLAVFAITLTLTKSKIMSSKREFVSERYASSFVGNMQPHFLHHWWHAIWTCPMCCGFWIALIVAIFMNGNFVLNALALYGCNWLLHCVENLFFQIGKYFEKKVDNLKNDV